MNLTYEQNKRYSRQLVMKEIGESGQKKLLSSSVLVIGAGGLGSPALMYLASAGVGTIGIADADEVDDGIDFGHYRLKLFKAGGLHSGSLLFRKLTGLSHKIPPGNCFLYYSTSRGGLQVGDFSRKKFQKVLIGPLYWTEPFVYCCQKNKRRHFQ